MQERRELPNSRRHVYPTMSTGTPLTSTCTPNAERGLTGSARTLPIGIVLRALNREARAQRELPNALTRVTAVWFRTPCW